MSEQLALLPGYLTAHLQLTLIALLHRHLVSVPLGILVTRVRWLEQPVLGVASVIQTIPSLALLAVMVPVLAASGCQSIGFLPAFIGLTLYSVLPILRNTVTGIDGVDPALHRGGARRGHDAVAAAAARGAAPGHAGDHRRHAHLDGLGRGHRDAVDAGRRHEPRQLHLQRPADAQLHGGARRLRRCRGAGPGARRPGPNRSRSAMRDRRRRRVVAAVRSALGALVRLHGGHVGVSAIASHGDEHVVVGAKTFTEQYILSDILAKRIQRRDGRADRRRCSPSARRSHSTRCATATSTSTWTTRARSGPPMMHRETCRSDRAEVLGEVRQFLHDDHGIAGRGDARLREHLRPGHARRPRRAGWASTRIGDLTPLRATDDRSAATTSSSAAPSGGGRRHLRAAIRGSAAQHGPVAHVPGGRSRATWTSSAPSPPTVASRPWTCACSRTTAAPSRPTTRLILATAKLARTHPEVIRTLRALDGTIDDDAMRGLNMRVDGQHENARNVAAQFLAHLGK